VSVVSDGRVDLILGDKYLELGANVGCQVPKAVVCVEEYSVRLG